MTRTQFKCMCHNKPHAADLECLSYTDNIFKQLKQYINSPEGVQEGETPLPLRTAYF